MHGISVVDDMDNVNVIVDLGNGIGLTTKKIAEIFPSASVYATNIEVSYQYKIASELATSCGFTMMSDLKDMPLQADMMFASEYFEHFDRPIEHLDYIMSLQKPRYMIIANGFNGDAIGHFDTYFHMDKSYSSKEMNKLFSACMIRHGYKRVKTRLWNDRPQYYKLAVPTVLNLCEQNPFTSSFNI
jgi:trans-aconitate methyltransferase